MGLFDLKTKSQEERDARKTDKAGVGIYLVGSLVCVPMYFMVGAILLKHAGLAIGVAVLVGLVFPIWASRRLAAVFNLLSFRSDEKATGRYNAAFATYGLLILAGGAFLKFMP